ncbi:MAG: hypothetical protein ACE5OZ_11735 [Candidatus Heimdallarchaeota archaeon]
MSMRTLIGTFIMILSAFGIVAMLAVPVASYTNGTGSSEEISVHLLNGDLDMNLGGLQGTYRWNDFYGQRTGVWPTWLILIMVVSCISAFLGGFLSITGSRNYRIAGSGIGISSGLLGLTSSFFFDKWWIETVFPILEEEIASREEWQYHGGNYIVGFIILLVLSFSLFFANYRSSDQLKIIKQPAAIYPEGSKADSSSIGFQERSKKRFVRCQACNAPMENSSANCSSCGVGMSSTNVDEIPQVLPRSEGENSN